MNTLEDKLNLLIDTKENLRLKLGLNKLVPFRDYKNYVNWQNIPSVPNSKTYADFKNNRYAKNGVPCDLKDIFNFTRAGKAWLVKENGLQEYDTDVPRFDGGLLIEKEATNLVSWALEPDKWITGMAYTYHKNIDGKNTAVKATRQTLGVNFVDVIAKSSKISTMYYGSGDTTPTDFTLYLRNNTTGTGVYSYRLGSMDYDLKIDNLTYKMFKKWETGFSAGNSIWFYQGTAAATVGLSFNFSARQITDGTIMSSLIKTEATPITRPADFLSSKITGTTVTGDWDSTLTLSIVGGQLVHDGYGTIRTLEIN